MREKLRKHPTAIAVLIGTAIGVLWALTSCSMLAPKANCFGPMTESQIAAHNAATTEALKNTP